MARTCRNLSAGRRTNGSLNESRSLLRLCGRGAMRYAMLCCVLSVDDDDDDDADRRPALCRERDWCEIRERAARCKTNLTSWKWVGPKRCLFGADYGEELCSEHLRD